MSDNQPRVILANSSRQAPSHERVGEPDPGTQAEVTVYLKGPRAERGSLSRQQYREAYGSTDADVKVVTDFAASHGLNVGDVERARRSIVLSGPLSAMTEAFGAQLGIYRAADGSTYRASEADLEVPSALAGVVQGVFGLDERPQAHPQFRPRVAADATYLPSQVAAAYSFPPGLTGKGQCVALIELGGGFREADLTQYFTQDVGLAQAPSVEAVSVVGGKNDPTTAQSADGEVMLDIEVVGSVAPGASIAVYFTKNTDRGFIDAVTTAVHDDKRNPSVISISWGGAESTWAQSAMEQMQEAFAAAAAMGVTVTVAAGDNGSSDGQSDGKAHVDFPASAPHALACGGTSVEIVNNQVESETVWNDGAGGGAGGGGISVVFSLPSYQSAANVPDNPLGKPGRGVPDVAGDADPDSGYTVRVDGQMMTVGGTSAVAPLWAGLIAAINEALASSGTSVGFLQPFLYSSEAAGQQLLHDITEGSNGAYQAGKGWDPCTGLGSPIGSALLSAIQAG